MRRRSTSTRRPTEKTGGGDRMEYGSVSVKLSASVCRCLCVYVEGGGSRRVQTGRGWCRPWLGARGCRMSTLR